MYLQVKLEYTIKNKVVIIKTNTSFNDDCGKLKNEKINFGNTMIIKQ